MPTGSTPAELVTAANTSDRVDSSGKSAGGSHVYGAPNPQDATNNLSPRLGEDPNPDTSSLSIRPPEEDVTRRASQRDEAAAAKPLLPRILQVVVAVFFPVILLAAAVRAVTTPLFLWIEYHRPGFPADSYGFSTEDRMTYGSYAMDYIVNWAPARYLGDLVNTDGDQLFLDSEVGHMADVKLVLSTGFVVATVLALIAILSCVYLARRYPGGVRRALFAGAAATLLLAVALAVVAILAWETFFTQVHALFFADGTWTFRLDDTLIRLFPAQFWIDAAGAVGALVLIVAGLTLAFTWPTGSRRDRSARAYAARRANSGI
ncbi:TIGR01906 family membrane protein [Arthrobacter sp. JZ12]|nr:TIGR01906 family membrane protein [Arthrobacter sp. JZ12]